MSKVNDRSNPSLNDPDRFAIFTFQAAPPLPFARAAGSVGKTAPEMAETFGKAVEAGLENGGMIKNLFSFGDEERGAHLFYGWFKAESIVVRHSHGQDCLYFILSGEAILGNQTLGVGDGFYVPADHPYAYRAGPRGVEVLEFRSVHPVDGSTYFLERRPEAWAKFLQVVVDQQEAWQAEVVPPSQRSRTDASVESS